MTYLIRKIDAEAMGQFRELCKEHNLSPQAVLKDFIATARINYQIASDQVVLKYHTNGKLL